MDVYKELKQKIRDVLSGMSGVSMDANGFYYSECYKDYRDEIPDNTIAEILKEEDPMVSFNERMDEVYFDEKRSFENQMYDKLLENEVISEFVEQHKLSDTDVRDSLLDLWYVQLPYEDYLKQEVCMDIMLDTGDCNYEFTCNNLASIDIESVEDFDDNSSLLWLCEQQGVTREELLSAFNKGTAHSDEVEGLKKRKFEIKEELKKYGFKEPNFRESVIHSGAYREFTKLQDELVTKQSHLKVLRSKYEENNISYDEYLKKHFDKFMLLNPLSQEQFDVKKAEILNSINAQIENIESDVKTIEEKLNSQTDIAAVAKLQDEYKSVVQRLNDLSKSDEFKKAEFINSVHNEILNSYGSSVVTFLVKMPLSKAIELQEIIAHEEDVNNSYYYEKRKGLSSFVIDKDVRCGLMDDSSGGGSVFEIKLIKDVEVPVKALYRAVPDKCNGNYGFMEIYGANDEFFKDSLKEVREVRQPKVSDLISDATKQSLAQDNREINKEDSLEL